TNPASMIYIRLKAKACDEIGILNESKYLDENISMDELLQIIDELNNDDDVDGILLQLPLPTGLDEKLALLKIDPSKDVDGLHYENLGKLFMGIDGFIPCTPLGVMELLNRSNVVIEGKNAVVVGRSNLVGKPIASLLEKSNATVSLCHSRTKNLAYYTKSADILIVAAGKPNFITGDMVKPNSIVIDVGINKLDGKLVGDVHFSDVVDKVKLVTPVPGGVGPMTIAMLMKNTVFSHCKRHNLEFHF
ncbi:MAG: bifunctional methylenetetrahydrofolate dehydrogenase/methenyltetrahydrofolate cyclohydrolase FolD, partial [Candidatus Heimdallarchaeota archaeon]|nr:bifunctional methylenetetrahydrofolate dehydrogenase/methenyltetrahydrofolate cyclohydrolase FolD [Candidatus Heimdallarchaeota archaeon]